MHPYLNIAIKAARRAGTIITRSMEQLDKLRIYEKGLNDLVTSVDKAVEQDIIETIHRAYPTHGILGEETGEHPGDEFTWVIDPIDGTMNFVHGFPQFCVSIGVLYKDYIEHGVIYDPITQDLYTASRGRGAQLNDKKIRVSEKISLSDSLISSSFPFRDREKGIEKHLDIFRAVFRQCADIRRTGSAALNLAYVASGKLDGFWESHLQPWDIAAGILLVKEAGGFITDFEGGYSCLKSGNVIAAPPKVHTDLLNIIKEKW